jgi:hypothetical protein
MARVKERWHVCGLRGQWPNEHYDVEHETTHGCGSISSGHVLQVFVNHRTEEARAEAKRRATLAASAPRLLEACKIALKEVKTPSVRQFVDAAIRSAEVE